ncbi:hypothetical protein NFI96_005627 [Prochilodus magdalenae]|nr:hypothetical protein NFI96_005627 [Prochilodus magdalenae]
MLYVLWQENNQSQARESPPVQWTDNSQGNGVYQPSMVTNSIYERIPGPIAISNGRPKAQEEDSGDDFPPPPSDLDTMESDLNPQQIYQQIRKEREPPGRPTYQQHQPTQRVPDYPTKASKSMDLDTAAFFRLLATISASSAEDDRVGSLHATTPPFFLLCWKRKGYFIPPKRGVLSVSNYTSLGLVSFVWKRKHPWKMRMRENWMCGRETQMFSAVQNKLALRKPP